MKNLTIRRRIIASFAVVLGLMLIMAAVAYTRLISIEQQVAHIASDALPGLTYTNQISVARISTGAAG
jgi:methyl-accepting chemotaxis protein WspA